MQGRGCVSNPPSQHPYLGAPNPLVVNNQQFGSSELASLILRRLMKVRAPGWGVPGVTPFSRALTCAGPGLPLLGSLTEKADEAFQSCS